MTQVFHLVGVAGSRKTTVAVLMATALRAEGKVCMLKDTLGGVNVFDDEFKGDFNCCGGADEAAADVLFVEHYPDDFTGGQPGDVVMRLSVVREGPAGGAADVGGGPVAPEVQALWAHEIKELDALHRA